MARSGTEPLMFLGCSGFKKNAQTDCRTYSPDGKLNYATKYTARSLSFDVIEIKDSFNNAAIFSDFVKIVKCQTVVYTTIQTFRDFYPRNRIKKNKSGRRNNSKE